MKDDMTKKMTRKIDAVRNAVFSKTRTKGVFKNNLSTFDSFLSSTFLLFFTIAMATTLTTLTSCKGGRHAPQSSATDSTNGSLSNSPSSKTGANSGVGPTYNDHIKPIFEKACVPCHAHGSPTGSWLDYNVAFSKKALIKSRVFEKKDMPMGKSIPEDQRILIAKWVDNGAPEKGPESEPQSNTDSSSSSSSGSGAINDTNAGTGTGTGTDTSAGGGSGSTITHQTPAEELTYVEHIKPLFEKYCSMCHNENSDVSMPNWLKYDIAVLKKDALLNRMIIKKDMPMAGMPAPSDEERELIHQWILKGMKYEKK